MGGSRLEHARHPLWVRAAHWIGAAAFLGLAVSGVAILLALPKLFWGETGANDAPAWVSLPLPVNLEQTGWGRNLHFLSAWAFVIAGGLYLAAAALGGRLYRRLWPDRDQVRPAHLAGEVRDHLSLGGDPRAAYAPRYNALQKLAYLAVLLVLAPTMLLSGLTMAPGVTAAFPELFTLFGGRQSARTVHFLTGCGLVLFLAVHLWQVLANGPRALMRAMILGRPERRDRR
ncbi:cytochrome b/b6 domain-containing protein [Methylobacterium sp. NEAU 140]|uniref:cytochrome b/b6 domain-containing protein n=1 Tax=Methylobacterium sp. NEAU 140 TaxID=3064945 RepID=UPI002736A586|nr:cytochrome b/b6 domain-containing protein [Methylobacterium sp. NEAU 140]MDP4021742.1 cytochrome b/b6 domain-containing protein [Methylobacterium sp. NEAU 140]